MQHASRRVRSSSRLLIVGVLPRRDRSRACARRGAAVAVPTALARGWRRAGNPRSATARRCSIRPRSCKSIGIERTRAACAGMAPGMPFFAALERSPVPLTIPLPVPPGANRLHAAPPGRRPRHVRVPRSFVSRVPPLSAVSATCSTPSPPLAPASMSAVAAWLRGSGRCGPAWDSAAESVVAVVVMTALCVLSATRDDVQDHAPRRRLRDLPRVRRIGTSPAQPGRGRLRHHAGRGDLRGADRPVPRVRVSEPDSRRALDGIGPAFHDSSRRLRHGVRAGLLRESDDTPVRPGGGELLRAADLSWRRDVDSRRRGACHVTPSRPDDLLPDRRSGGSADHVRHRRCDAGRCRRSSASRGGAVAFRAADDRGTRNRGGICRRSPAA